MSRAIIYSTFFILSVGVIVVLLISFKVIKNPIEIDKDIQKNSKLADLIDLGSDFDIRDSWLYQIGNEDRGKDYSFAKIEIELELN